MRLELISVLVPGPMLTSVSRYWQFLLYLFIILTLFELVLAPFRSLYPTYSSLIGYIGLSIEAILPLPQIFANARSRSCKGFRLSVLASWLLGDGMKMFWFFTSPTEIPWAFKLCGLFQAGCDTFLGIQYLMYGNGEGPPKGRFLSGTLPGSQQRPFVKREGGGLGAPIGLHTASISEKDS